MLSFDLDMSVEVCHNILQDAVVKALYLKLFILFGEQKIVLKREF